MELSTGREVFRGDLGAFDVFNHALRLDAEDGAGPFFLRGDPPGQHQQKQLCRLTPGGESQAVMRWDDQERHTMDPSACMLEDGAILTGCRIWHPRPGAGGRLLRAREPDGRARSARVAGVLSSARGWSRAWGFRR